MAPSRAQFRVLIFYDFKRGLDYNQCHQNLVEAFGGDAPSARTVLNWFHEFARGHETFEDEPRSGRPSDAVTPENADRVRELIKSQRNLTCREIEDTLKIGSAALNVILHELLGVRKVANRWISHLLTEDQKRQ